MPDKNDLPPGLLRSFERGAVDDDLPPAEDSGRSTLVLWATQNLTVTNALLAVVFLFQLGQGYQRWTSQQADAARDLLTKVGAIEIRLQAAENASKTTADIYVRKDVIDEALKAMEQRLTTIEALIREQKGRQQQ